ncbi:WS/DGAT domain-containing protein [Bradyrhizobium sp. JR3.5]
MRELKPVLGVPITGSPWLMTGLASLLGRSNLASRMPAAGNVLISNVPGPGQHLYMAGARMVHYFPVSIPYHGSGLNITVHSYASLLEFGLTACRRVLTQDESYEMIEHLRAALRAIEALPPVEAEIVELTAQAATQSKAASAVAASVTVIQADEVPPAAANDKASRAS